MNSTLEMAHSPHAGRSADSMHSASAVHTAPRRPADRPDRTGPAWTDTAPAAARTDRQTILQAVDLHKTYRKERVEVPVLKGVDLDIYAGEQTAIIGQSGSGKSTLLHLMGTLDLPDRGHVFFEGNRIDHLSTPGRDLLRNKYFGLIFQFYHLLPELTTLENVLVPIMINQSVWRYWLGRKKFRRRAERLLEMVGLAHRLQHKPKELSGGELQRAAIARALIAEPTLLLADEPTGNLDGATGEEILDILRTLNAEENLTIVIVTHDASIAARAHRVVRLVEGRVVEQ